VRERDRCCRFPDCDNHQWVDAHHIIHWADGGETSLDNLVLLCRRHHRLVHEGGFSVERLPSEEIVFRDPRGRRLRNSSPAPHASPSLLRAQNRKAGLEIGADTLLIGSGERMDLALCVDAVADA
jgi:HNH endonuclease